MGSESALPALHVTLAEFNAQFAAELVAPKVNSDSKGNLRGALPLSAIVSEYTAEYGNLADDLIRALSMRGAKVAANVLAEGATLDGVADDTAAIQAAINRMAAAGGGLVIVPVGTPTHTALTRPAGVRLLHLCSGDPNTARDGVAGDLAVRLTGPDTIYTKTGTGTSGWAALGAGTVHREPFGGDSSTALSEIFVPFGSSVVERASSTGPRTWNIWRAPVAGTITQVDLLHESNAGGVTGQWYESDGLTTRGSSVLGPTTTYTLGVVPGYRSSLAMDVPVAVGDLLCLGLDAVGAIGEFTGWLEVTPS